MRTLTLSLVTATLTALLVLALAHYGHATILPTYATSDSIVVRLEHESTSLDERTLGWSFEALGHVDTTDVSWTLDSLTALPPSEVALQGTDHIQLYLAASGFDPRAEITPIRVDGTFTAGSPGTYGFPPGAHGGLDTVTLMGDIWLGQIDVGHLVVDYTGTPSPIHLEEEMFAGSAMHVACDRGPSPACQASLILGAGSGIITQLSAYYPNGRDLEATFPDRVGIHLVAAQAPEPSTMELIFLALIVVGIVKGTTKCV